MAELSKNNKGIVLVIVLATILVSVLLATAVMHLITNQSRLTHHQLSRIQAYYAGKAAITYAQEKLRIGGPPAVGGWVAGTNCTAAAPCVAASPVTDPATQFQLDLVNDFSPASMRPTTSCPLCGVSITIIPAQYTNSLAACYRNDTKACISTTATYTYTTP